MALPTYSIVVIGAEATATIAYTAGTEVTIARDDVTLLTEDYLLDYVASRHLDSVDAALIDLGIADMREVVSYG